MVDTNSHFHFLPPVTQRTHVWHPSTKRRYNTGRPQNRNLPIIRRYSIPRSQPPPIRLQRSIPVRLSKIRAFLQIIKYGILSILIIITLFTMTFMLGCIGLSIYHIVLGIASLCWFFPEIRDNLDYK